MTLICPVYVHLNILPILVPLLSSFSIPIIIIVVIAQLIRLIVSDIAHGLIIGGFTISDKGIASQLLQNLQLGPLYILQTPLYLLRTHAPI